MNEIDSIMEDTHARIAVNIILFLALDAREQANNIGISRNWFCKENTDVNPGANYLIGSEGVFLEYSLALFDLVDDDTATLIKQIKQTFDQMDSFDQVWSKYELETNEYWKLLRYYSGEILQKLRIVERKYLPIFIPDLIRIERPYFENTDDWWQGE